eukprot:TRINITY_DN678_c1_g1_i1.p1 TRINITY_DN678_c1_g1~~TRINITY_DN678_c1_g1_i1.p1  ORF type:complete len:121 (-),score=1.68 TRINITY_DN678_c1_g1_i1:42-404(-)
MLKSNNLLDEFMAEVKGQLAKCEADACRFYNFDFECGVPLSETSHNRFQWIPIHRKIERTKGKRRYSTTKNSNAPCIETYLQSNHRGVRNEIRRRINMKGAISDIEADFVCRKRKKWSDE